MKRFGILLVVLVFLLQAGQAGAIYVQDSQQEFILVIEQGGEYEFPLVIQDVKETADVLSSGEIADWVGFGEENKNNYTVYHFSIIAILPVIISVPDDTEIGEYRGEIKAGTDTLSDITVRVTLPMADIRVLQEFSDIDEKIEKLKSQIGDISRDILGGIGLTEEALLSRIETLKQYEKEIVRLNEEKAELQKDVKEMEGREFQFTGQMAGSVSTIGFAIGLIIGIIIAFLFINREPIHKRLSRSP